MPSPNRLSVNEGSVAGASALGALATQVIVGEVTGSDVMRSPEVASTLTVLLTGLFAGVYRRIRFWE